jgi:tyrosyl-tRNA synthetase
VLAVDRAELEAGLPVIEALHRAGFCASKGEARRLVRNAGVRVNDAPATDENRRLDSSDLDPTGTIKLSAGRKKHVLVRIG